MLNPGYRIQRLQSEEVEYKEVKKGFQIGLEEKRH